MKTQVEEPSETTEKVPENVFYYEIATSLSLLATIIVEFRRNEHQECRNGR
ncbi:MAG: hypothetical protein WAO57_09390 [Syntrophomonadaceae bacterium]